MEKVSLDGLSYRIFFQNDVGFRAAVDQLLDFLVEALITGTRWCDSLGKAR